MVDHLSGFPIAEAIPNKEAVTVADANLQQVDSRAHLPKDLVVRQWQRVHK